MGLFNGMLLTGMMPSAIAKEMVVSSACDPLDFAIWPRMMSKMLEIPRDRTNVQMRANVLTAAAEMRRDPNFANECA